MLFLSLGDCLGVSCLFAQLLPGLSVWPVCGFVFANTSACRVYMSASKVSFVLVGIFQRVSICNSDHQIPAWNGATQSSTSRLLNMLHRRCIRNCDPWILVVDCWLSVGLCCIWLVKFCLCVCSKSADVLELISFSSRMSSRSGCNSITFSATRIFCSLKLSAKVGLERSWTTFESTLLCLCWLAVQVSEVDLAHLQG